MKLVEVEAGEERLSQLNPTHGAHDPPCRGTALTGPPRPSQPPMTLQSPLGVPHGPHQPPRAVAEPRAAALQALQPPRGPQSPPGPPTERNTGSRSPAPTLLQQLSLSRSRTVPYRTRASPRPSRLPHYGGRPGGTNPVRNPRATQHRPHPQLPILQAFVTLYGREVGRAAPHVRPARPSIAKAGSQGTPVCSTGSDISAVLMPRPGSSTLVKHVAARSATKAWAALYASSLCALSSPRSLLEYSPSSEACELS